MGDRPTLKAMFTWRSAICDSDLPPTTRHVALTLSLHLNERSASAHPGALCLSRETGYSLRCVREHLAILERSGWLHLVKKGGIAGERRLANEYALVVPDPVLPITGDPAAPVQTTTGTGDPDDTDGVRRFTPTQRNSKNSEGRKKLPPKDWQPSETTRTWAAAKRPDLDVDEMAERFVDYCYAKNAKYADFDAALKNWLRSERPGEHKQAEPQGARLELLGQRKCPFDVCSGDGWDPHGSNGVAKPCRCRTMKARTA